jgi:hypothetical protein
MNNKNGKVLVLSLIAAIAIIGIVAGGTYAFITASATATNITQIKSGNLTMTVAGGGNQSVSFVPTTCTNSTYAIKRTITATAVNTSGGSVSFTIGLKPTILDSGLKITNMKWALTTNSSSCTSGVVASGNFANASAGTAFNMVTNDRTGITQDSTDTTKFTKTYYLYIWLDSAQTSNVSGSLSVTVTGSVTNTPA